MKATIKLLFSIALVICATSCEREEAIEKSLAGKWEYIIELSFEGTNYNTGQSISGTKIFSGTFTWDETLDGYLEGDLENSYSYLDGYIVDDFLDFYDEDRLGLDDDSFYWYEDGKQYEAYCAWKNIPVKYNMKEFTTESSSYSWVEITYPDDSEVYCSNVEATLEARKIR